MIDFQGMSRRQAFVATVRALLDLMPQEERVSWGELPLTDKAPVVLRLQLVVDQDHVVFSHDLEHEPDLYGICWRIGTVAADDTATMSEFLHANRDLGDRHAAGYAMDASGVVYLCESHRLAADITPLLDRLQAAIPALALTRARLAPRD